MKEMRGLMDRIFPILYKNTFFSLIPTTKNLLYLLLLLKIIPKTTIQAEISTISIKSLCDYPIKNQFMNKTISNNRKWRFSLFYPTRILYLSIARRIGGKFQKREFRPYFDDFLQLL
jgi:hypothetical protein